MTATRRSILVTSALVVTSAVFGAEAPRPIAPPPDAPAGTRVVAPEGLGVAFASWDAAGEHRVALSRDGGRSWAPSVPMRYEIPLRAGTLLPGRVAPELPDALRAREGDRLAIVQFETKGVEAYRRAVRDAGGELLAYLPGNAWIARLDAAARARVAKLPFVRFVGAFEPGYKIDPDVVREIVTRSASVPPRRYHLTTFTSGPAEKALLASEVSEIGGAVAAEIPHGYLLDAMLTDAQVLAIAHSTHLAWLDRWSAPENDMDLVREQSGANYVESVAGYSGQGVRGEVMDCGVMSSHQDFDGKITHGPPSNDCDHGTCTYGIVFGNGNRDGDGDAKATGMIPSAQGIFYDYDNLVDRYQETAELNQAPYFAVFQSNSWGDARTRAYDSISQQMDDIIWTYDIAIFQSQSNAGNQDSRPQAWAKNIISIGAVNHFDTPTLADDCWCSTGSIGPAADGRIKPDLAYWYDDIYTTDLEPGGYSTGLYTPGFGGTSAATPIVAGIGGLYFQMWADNILGNSPAGTTVFERRPHAMTTKALMINLADQYPFTGTGADMTRVHQGWGLPSAKNFYDRRARVKVVNEENLLHEGETHTYSATVPAGETALRVTMAYMDRAGTTSSTLHRINDVTLKVTDPGGSVSYWGNVGLDAGNWSTPGGAPNSIDTVENVFVQNPSAGSWTIEVSADDLNVDVHQETPELDQDYALVASGVSDLSYGCAVRPPGPTSLVATPNGDNRIDLVWDPTATAQEYRVYRSSTGCAGTRTLVGQVPAGTTTFSDTTVSGGSAYSYTVTSFESCESFSSNCSTATASGACFLTPGFSGAQAAASADASGCGVNVSWAAATNACGGPMVYNVYRGTSSSFVPGPQNRVGSCVSGTSFLDTRGLQSHTTYYYRVRAEDLGGRGGPTCNGATESNNVVVSTKVKGPDGTMLDNDFESGVQGWTMAKGTPPATAGDFVRGTPNPTIVGPNLAQPNGCIGGSQCLFTGQNSGGSAANGDVDGGEVTTTSGVFSAAGFGTARLTLARWHFNAASQSDPGDHYVLESSSDGGGSWTTLESLGPLQSAGTWTSVGIDLETLTPLTSQMRLRVRSADGPAIENIVETAIDNVKVKGSLLCATQAPAALGGVADDALLVEKDAAGIRLSWGPDCGGGTGFSVYRGDLAAGYASLAPVAGLCGVGGTSVTFDPGPGSSFFLVAPNDGTLEGSLGRDGSGNPRPQPSGACWPRAASINACAP